MRKVDDREKIYRSGVLHPYQGGYILFRWVIWTFRGSMLLKGGYMLSSGVILLFRGVICCSGGLYDKKIIMVLVATYVVASRTQTNRNADSLCQKEED